MSALALTPTMTTTTAIAPSVGAVPGRSDAADAHGASD